MTSFYVFSATPESKSFFRFDIPKDYVIQTDGKWWQHIHRFGTQIKDFASHKHYQFLVEHASKLKFSQYYSVDDIFNLVDNNSSSIQQDIAFAIDEQCKDLIRCYPNHWSGGSVSWQKLARNHHNHDIKGPPDRDQDGVVLEMFDIRNQMSLVAANLVDQNGQNPLLFSGTRLVSIDSKMWRYFSYNVKDTIAMRDLSLWNHSYLLPMTTSSLQEDDDIKYYVYLRCLYMQDVIVQGVDNKSSGQAIKFLAYKKDGSVSDIPNYRFHPMYIRMQFITSQLSTVAFEHWTQHFEPVNFVTRNSHLLLAINHDSTFFMRHFDSFGGPVDEEKQETITRELYKINATDMSPVIHAYVVNNEKMDEDIEYGDFDDIFLDLANFGFDMHVNFGMFEWSLEQVQNRHALYK